MTELLPGPSFVGDGWAVVVTDDDPLDHVPPPDGQQVVVLGLPTRADSVRRLTKAGRQVVIVCPTAGIDRAVGLAVELAA